MRRLKYISKVLRFLPPEIPGKARLARRLLGSCLQARDIMVNGQDGIKFLVPSLREPIGFYLLVDGVYEPKAINFVLKHIETWNRCSLTLGRILGFLRFRPR